MEGKIVMADRVLLTSQRIYIKLDVLHKTKKLFFFSFLKISTGSDIPFKESQLLVMMTFLKM
jgi:hypothetical protein